MSRIPKRDPNLIGYREAIHQSAALIGHKGGLVKSERKKAANKVNGAKGGRPRQYVAIFGKETDKFYQWSERLNTEQEALDWIESYCLNVIRAGWKPPEGGFQSEILTGKAAWLRGCR